MSKARSPRDVCSTTMGTRGLIGSSLRFAASVRCSSLCEDVPPRRSGKRSNGPRGALTGRSAPAAPARARPRGPSAGAQRVDQQLEVAAPVEARAGLRHRRAQAAHELGMSSAREVGAHRPGGLGAGDELRVERRAAASRAGAACAHTASRSLISACACRRPRPRARRCGAACRRRPRTARRRRRQRRACASRAEALERWRTSSPISASLVGKWR